MTRRRRGPPRSGWRAEELCGRRLARERWHNWICRWVEGIQGHEKSEWGSQCSVKRSEEYGPGHGKEEKDVSSCDDVLLLEAFTH